MHIMLTIMSDEARENCFKSLSSSTKQANADVQALSLDAMGIFLSQEDKEKAEANARKGIASMQRLANTIRDDAGLSARRWAKWVEATVSMKVREGTVSKDGKICRLRNGVTEDNIKLWHQFTPNTPDAKVQLFGFDQLFVQLDKYENDDCGKTKKVSADVRSIIPVIRKAAEAARAELTASRLASKPAKPAKSEESAEDSDLFADLPATSAAS